MEKIAAADKMRMQMLCERLTACVAAIDGHFEHSNFVHLHPHLSTKNGLFSEPPTCYQRKQDSKRWKLKISYSQGGAAALTIM